MYLTDVSLPISGSIVYEKINRIYDQNALDAYIDREINDKALCFGAHGPDCYYSVIFSQDPASWLIHCAVKVELDDLYVMTGGSLGRRPSHSFNRALATLHVINLKEEEQSRRSAQLIALRSRLPKMEIAENEEDQKFGVA